MKKRALAIVICLFLLVAFCIVYIFSELYTESEIPTPSNKDALKFKEEYESLNGTSAGKDQVIRSLSISEDNPFVYKTADDIVEMIDNKETFVVYFGFSTCPWCRSVLESLIESAKINKVDTIYYVDVKNIRDKYELDKNHKAVRTVEGSEGYYKLLDRLDSVLENYSPLVYTTKKNKIKEVKISEKRIYAPNVIVVKDGKPLMMEEGISSKQESAYMDLTDEIKKDSIYKFNCLFELLISEDYTCSCEDQKC